MRNGLENLYRSVYKSGIHHLLRIPCERSCLHSSNVEPCVGTSMHATQCSIHNFSTHLQQQEPVLFALRTDTPYRLLFFLLFSNEL